MIIPVSKQKCLNMNRNHKLPAYYCDDCLKEVRQNVIEKILEIIDKQIKAYQDANCSTIQLNQIRTNIEMLK